MIRTHIVPCRLDRTVADAFNRESGHIYTGVLVAYWRVVRKKSIWLSEKAGTRLSDDRTNAKLHAHTIDAAQEGFYKACATAKAMKRIALSRLAPLGTTAKSLHWPKMFRTTIWKNTGITRWGDELVLSTGRGNPKITVGIPESVRDARWFLEVRLVYSKRARRYNWHIVVENGKQPKPAPGTNVVSVDLGEIHPAVVGDDSEATIITCRERRHEAQGHAKRLASMAKAISRKKRGSLRYKKLLRSKSRLNAKHERVVRDMGHKISRAIVDVAVKCRAGTMMMGDIRDIADGVDLGKRTNQKISGWSHGKVRVFVDTRPKRKGSPWCCKTSITQARPARIVAADTNRGALLSLPVLWVSVAPRRRWADQYPLCVHVWRTWEDSSAARSEASYAA